MDVLIDILTNPVVAFIIVIGVLILVHELGHLLTAKAVDIEVPRFSIGFGPRLFGFRRGETEYVVSLLPLGGYVKMAGMEELEMVEGQTDSPRAEGKQPSPRHFDAKSLPARMLVISAGVIMNFLFAVLVFGIVGAVWGVPIEPPAVLGGVTEEYLNEGTESLVAVPRGTRIVSIGGEAVEDWGDVRLVVSMMRPGENVIEFENAPPVTVDVAGTDSARFQLFAALEPVVQVAPRLQQVVPDGPGARAGLQAGDVIVTAAGEPVNSWQEFVTAVEARPGQPLDLVVERDGARVDTNVVPEPSQLPGGHTYGRIGVQGAPSETGQPRERLGVLDAAAYGFERTWEVVVLTVDFLGGMFTGRHSARNIGGPIAIGQISGQVAEAGLESFLNFLALFSVNLAVLNLLPIPVLDGGQLMFLLYEGIRGKPPSMQARMRLTQIGFFIILLIMAWAIGNDLLRAFGF